MLASNIKGRVNCLVPDRTRIFKWLGIGAGFSIGKKIGKIESSRYISVRNGLAWLLVGSKSWILWDDTVLFCFFFLAPPPPRTWTF